MKYLINKCYRVHSKSKDRAAAVAFIPIIIKIAQGLREAINNAIVVVQVHNKFYCKYITQRCSVYISKFSITSWFMVCYIVGAFVMRPGLTN